MGAVNLEGVRTGDIVVVVEPDTVNLSLSDSAEFKVDYGTSSDLIVEKNVFPGVATEAYGIVVQNGDRTVVLPAAKAAGWVSRKA